MSIPLVSCFHDNVLRCVLEKIFLFIELVTLVLCVFYIWRGFQSDPIARRKKYRLLILGSCALTCMIVIVHYSFVQGSIA